MTEEKQGYKKALGFWHVVFLTIGAILGPAVAFVPVTVLALGGPAGIVSWPIAFVLILPIAYIYVELGAMWPKAGGVAYYPAKSHGAIAGLLNGWSAFVGYSLAMPAVVAAIVEYSAYYVPQFYNTSGTALSYLGIGVAIVATIVVFLINTRTIRFIGTLNNVVTVVKMALIMVVSVALLFFFKASNLTGFGGFSPMGAAGVFLAVSATIFAYAGFRQPIDYAEEVHNPGKFLPKAIIASLAIVMVFYIIESLAFVGTINWHALSLSPGNWSGLSSLGYPYASASLAVGLSLFAAIAIIGVVIASFSDGIIYYGGAARVGNTLARYDRYFPSLFGKINKRGIPYNSVVLVLVISIIYLILLPSFTKILGVFVDAVVFSYAPSAVSLAVFRKKLPNENRPFVLPFYRVISPLAFVVGGLLIYWSGFTAVSISIISVFVGLLFLIYIVRRKWFSMADFKSGIWLPAYMVAILVLSYIGSSTFGGINIIVFPYDVIVFIAVTLVFYFIGYYSGLGYTGKGVVEDEAPIEL
ncbi:MAG: APC family permease [Candidatus Thermoplasmatota archaeon]|jgi:amino acid transporter|nr:APC family permease [Candidatus Thermoplasmatota archaeon]MCL5790014.1 APC family permease [Candidatus Thermoplasmatota archaeon]